jgi:signal transduction histidine kinase
MVRTLYGRLSETLAVGWVALKAMPSRKKRGASPRQTELLAVLNSLSEGIAILDLGLEIRLMNTALRSMAASAKDAPTPDQKLFHARCFVPDQLLVIEEEMLKTPGLPRTDIIQLEHPKQFLKRYHAPLYNEAREQTGFLVSYYDITHEVLLDKTRQEFIANASHELRTPVTSLKVLLENLLDGAKDDPSVRDEFIRDAAQEGDRLHELVNDLLDLSSLESGRATLKLSAFELKSVIAEAIATVAPQAKQREVSLSEELPETALTLEADIARIRQVMVNLVANAVKFTPAGGAVTIRAWGENSSVRFAVSDTGIGIPAGDLPHIFDRFYRVTKGRSRLQGGSGLGLTIAKQAIDAHKGALSVESTEGQGSTFHVSLPAVQNWDE